MDELEAAKRLLNDVNPKSRGPLTSMIANDIRTVAKAVLAAHDQHSELAERIAYDVAEDATGTESIHELLKNAALIALRFSQIPS